MRSLLNNVSGASVCTGAMIGLVAGFALGVGGMHKRFEIEIGGYDKMHAFAQSCDYVLHLAGLKGN